MRLETTIGTTPLTKMSIDTGDLEPVSQKPYPVTMKHYQWVKDEIKKLLTAKVIRGKQIKLVSTHHSHTKGRWRKACLVTDYLSPQQSNKEVYLAYA